MKILDRIKKFVFIEEEDIEEVIEKEIPKIEENKTIKKPQIDKAINVNLGDTLEIIEKTNDQVKPKFGLDLELSDEKVEKIAIKKENVKIEKKKVDSDNSYVVKDIISPIFGTSHSKDTESSEIKQVKKTKKVNKTKKEYDANLNTILSPIYGDRSVNHLSESEVEDEIEETSAVASYISENKLESKDNNSIDQSDLTTLDDILETNDREYEDEVNIKGSKQ